MNADTITIDQIKTLSLSVKAIAASLDLIAHMASVGDIGPDEAADRVLELMEKLGKSAD